MGLQLVDSLNCKESSEGLTFLVHLIPNARKDEILGVESGALRARVNAPPVEGKANLALIKMLARQLGVRKGDVEIVRGETGRHKTVRVHGITLAKLLEAISQGSMR